MENPYETPRTTPQEEVYAEDTERVIPENPIKLDATWCLKRGWKLTCQNFGLFFMCIMLPLIIIGIVNIILSMVAASIDGQTTTVIENQAILEKNMGFATIVINVLSNMLSIIINMGFIRVGLDYLDGKQIFVSTTFSQTSKILKGFIAYFLFSLSVGIGMLLLIVPGIYIVTRYGFFLHAIVDKDCGIIDSFKYSSKLTRNNKMNLFVLLLLSGLVGLAGVLALFVGLLWAYPTIFLAMTIAYCSLHHGKSSKLEQI